MYGIVNYKDKHFDKIGPNTFLKKCILLDGTNIKVKTKKQKDINNYFYEIINNYDDTYYLGNKIGTVGKEEDERLFLEYRNNIKWKKISKKIYDQSLNKDDPDILKRIDLTDKYCLSIDPEGSKDIDDCLHYEENKNIIEIGIHIADVSSYVIEGSELDKILFERCESKYFPWKTHHMLGEKYSTDICSLRKVKKGDKKKRAMSLILSFDQEGSLLKKDIVCSYIINRRELSYKNAEELMIDESNYTGIYIKKLYDFGIILKKKFELNSVNNYDIHKMVEVYMLIANIIIAEKMSLCKNNIILRVQNKNKKNTVVSEENIDDTFLLEQINKFNMDSAKYIDNVNADTYHYSLNKKFYTHFTSPIRRYIDIIVHRKIKSIINTDERKININLKSICDYINDKKKCLKKAYRECLLLKTFYKIYNNNDGIYDYEGYIIDLDESIMLIFINKLNLNINYKILNKKTNHLFKVEINDNLSIKIINKETNEIINYSLYQKINIRITFCKNEGLFHKKFQIQLI